MCSPFSTPQWRKYSYESLKSQEHSTEKHFSERHERGRRLRDCESFRVFSSFNEILSEVERERVTTENEPLLKKIKGYRLKAGVGLALTAASGVLFALASLFVKLSNSDIPAFQIIFVRLVIQTMMVQPPAIYARVNILGERKRRPYLLLFGAVNFASISAIYGAFTMLPLGDATVIISTTPIFTAVFAYFFLKETWSKVQATATFICLTGIVLIARPTFIFGNTGRSHLTESQRLIGYLVALIGAIVQAITFVMVRKGGRYVSFYTNVFYFGWVSAVLSVIPMVVIQKPVLPVCGSSRWFLLGVGLSGVFGSLCLNRGLQLENAAPAALMRNVDIVFAFLFDVVVFDEHPTALTLCGGFFVLLSTGGVALAKWWSATRKEDVCGDDHEDEFQSQPHLMEDK